MLFELKTSFRQGRLSSSLIRVYKSRNLVGLEFHHVLMEFQFLITKTKGRTFLQMFKVRIQVLWCEKNTASHKKKYTYLIGSWWPIHTASTGPMSPRCCRRKECIKATSPVSDPFSSLSLLAIVLASTSTSIYCIYSSTFYASRRVKK